VHFLALKKPYDMRKWLLKLLMLGLNVLVTNMSLTPLGDLHSLRQVMALRRLSDVIKILVYSRSVNCWLAISVRKTWVCGYSMEWGADGGDVQ
jgi:hypothetical protein